MKLKRILRKKLKFIKYSLESSYLLNSFLALCSTNHHYVYIICISKSQLHTKLCYQFFFLNSSSPFCFFILCHTKWQLLYDTIWKVVCLLDLYLKYCCWGVKPQQSINQSDLSACVWQLPDDNLRTGQWFFLIFTQLKLFSTVNTG